MNDPQRQLSVIVDVFAKDLFHSTSPETLKLRQDVLNLARMVREEGLIKVYPIVVFFWIMIFIYGYLFFPYLMVNVIIYFFAISGRLDQLGEMFFSRKGGDLLFYVLWFWTNSIYLVLCEHGVRGDFLAISSMLLEGAHSAFNYARVCAIIFSTNSERRFNSIEILIETLCIEIAPVKLLASWVDCLPLEFWDKIGAYLMWFPLLPLLLTDFNYLEYRENRYNFFHEIVLWLTFLFRYIPNIVYIIAVGFFVLKIEEVENWLAQAQNWNTTPVSPAVDTTCSITDRDNKLQFISFGTMGCTHILRSLGEIPQELQIVLMLPDTMGKPLRFVGLLAVYWETVSKRKGSVIFVAGAIAIGFSLLIVRKLNWRLFYSIKDF